jgi:phosphotransacetylase
MFKMKKLLAEAKRRQRTIVYPEAGFSDRIIEAVKILNKKKIVKPILIGDESALVVRHKELSKFTIINPICLTFPT